ncbi:MAG: hypothetical protein IJA97_01420 [Clostridia bacterium]|nr:hypothetical protein [Clostridia bacterium]
MIADYGERAYIKVVELEKQMEKRFSELERKSYSSLFFDLSFPEKHASFSKSVKFVARADGSVNCILTIGTPEGISVTYEVLLLGKIIKTGTLAQTADVTFNIGVYEGENELTIKLYCGVPFTLNNLKLSLGGAVDYFNSRRRVSIVTNGEVNYITFLSDESYSLYAYDGGGLKYALTKKGIIDACIGGILGDELYIVNVNKNNELCVMTYNVKTSSGMNTVAKATGVTSVCAFPYGDGIKIIFVKSGEVFTGYYVKNEDFSCETTSRRASLVFADADNVGAYVLYDDFKQIKFIV